MRTKVTLVKTIIGVCSLILVGCDKSEVTTEQPAAHIYTATPEPEVKGGWRKMGTFFNNVTKIKYLFTAQGKAYVMVDTYPDPEGTDFFQYDPVANTFIPKAKLPLKNWDKTGWGMSINDKGYYIAANKFWEYDHINNIWLPKADFPIETARHPGLLSINDKGYLAGYNNTEGYRKNDTTYEYDPSKNSWSVKADHVSFYASLTTDLTFSTEGRAFMIIKNSTLIQAHEYLPDSNDWVYRSQSPLEKMPLAAWSTKENGYLLADDNKTVWKFDPKTYVWTKSVDFPGQSRAIVQGFSIGNKSYIGFGDIGYLKTDALNDLWEYNP